MPPAYQPVNTPVTADRTKPAGAQPQQMVTVPWRDFFDTLAAFVNGGGGGGIAPANGPYVTYASDPTLTAERVATDTATIDVDLTVANQARWHIFDNAVSNAKLRDSAGVSVIGRSANSVGDPADIIASANGQVLTRRADVLGFHAFESLGRYEPLTDGDLTQPELVFALGDVVMVWRPM